MFEVWGIIKRNLFPLKLYNKSQSGHKSSGPVFFATSRNELLPLPTNYWHLMPAINGTFGGFFPRSPTFTVRLFAGEKGPEDQTHSLTHPQSVGGILGPRGDRWVLNLLQNFASSAPYTGERGVKSKMCKIRASCQLMEKWRKENCSLAKYFHKICNLRSNMCQWKNKRLRESGA